MPDEGARERIARLPPVKAAGEQVLPDECRAIRFVCVARNRFALIDVSAQQYLGWALRVIEHRIDKRATGELLERCDVTFRREAVRLAVLVHKICNEDLHCFRTTHC